MRGWVELLPRALRLGEVRAFSCIRGAHAFRVAEMRDGRWQTSSTSSLDRSGKLEGSFLSPEAAVRAMREARAPVPSWGAP